MSQPQDFRQMTAQTIGKDLLSTLVTELRLLPDVWPKLAKAKQDDVIDRLRDRVEHNIKMAVHLLASEGRTVVAGDLEQITIKDGVKAVVKFGAGAENLHDLYDANKKAVLLVVANPSDHTGGMDEIHGENDQRNLDLGHEYKPNSDGEGMNQASGGDTLGLPSPDQVKPSDEELQAAFEEGYQAAADGKTKSDCPTVRSELVAEWVRGWNAWREEYEEREQ